MKNQSESLYFSFAIENDDTYHKICSFKQLAVGWHFGEGGPVDDDVIALACQLNQAARSAGFQATDAFAGLDGSLSLTLYHRDEFYELILSPEGTVTFVRECGGQELDYLELIDVHQATALIEKFSPLSWKTTYESFTKTSMTKRASDLAAGPSPEVTVSPSFAKCASYSPVWEFASTSKPITMTRASPATHRFFGSSLGSNSRKNVCLNKKQPPAAMFATTTLKTSHRARRVA